MAAAEQRVPRAFRRQYLLTQQGRFNRVTIPMTRNFVSFLELYGSFAGEALAESEDETAVESNEVRHALLKIC